MNCLITKLKENVVKDENFPSLNGMKVIIKNSGPKDLIFVRFATPGIITSVTGFYDTSDNFIHEFKAPSTYDIGITIKDSEYTDLVFSPTLKNFTISKSNIGECVIPFVGSMPNLEAINIGNNKLTLDIDTMYTPLLNLIKVNSKNISGNIESLKHCKLTNFNFENTNVSGDIKSVYSESTIVYLGNCTDIYGDIKNLLAYKATDIHLYGTQCCGDIKNYLDKCIENGKVSGQVKIYGNNSISYLGIRHNLVTAVFSGEGYIVNTN